MRLKKGFALQRLCDENIIVAYGPGNIDYTRVISLNESATLLWRWAEGRNFSAEEMADALTREYAVERQTALRDVARMLDKWNSLGLLETYTNNTKTNV